MNPDLRELLTRVDLFRLHPRLHEHQTYCSSGERWVTLGGVRGRQPYLAAAKRYRPENFPPGEEAESAHWEPGWFDVDRPYLPYVPD